MNAQPARADSLRAVIAATADPSVKTTLLFSLCDAYRFFNMDSCYRTAQVMYRLAQQRNDSLNMSAAALYYGFYFNYTGRPDTVLTIAQHNINWLTARQIKSALLCKYYALGGLACMTMNRHKEALEHFYAYLKTAEAIGDKEHQFKAFNNIGWALMELNQFDNAIINFKKALTLIHANHFPDKYGSIYNNIASCYGSLSKTDSTAKYAGMGIQIANRYGDIVAEANGLNIMGTFLTKEKKYAAALEYFLKAKPLREQIGDPFFLVSDMAVMAELYAKTGKPQEGIKICREALTIAQENKIEAKIPMIYAAMAANYETSGDYAAASDVYKKLNTLKDTLYANANPKALAEMQAKYETEKKEQQIQLQQLSISKKNTQLFIAIGLLLAGLLMTYLLYNRYKLKQQSRLQAEIMKQQDLSTRAVLEAEERERQRIAKDLHDGVGQMMSAAKMNLSAIESEIPFPDNNQKLKFEKIISLVDDSCREVRTVSHNMMPNALLKSGLAMAIKAFIDKIDSDVIKVTLHSEGLNERLDSNTETILYRVIQECVNNVIKHAGANRLDIALIRDAGGISATVEDNGKGFDATGKDAFSGLGLKNIQTRIAYLKGTVDFDAAPGKGTLVAIHVPLEP
jgi:signal transduction histidine kinase